MTRRAPMAPELAPPEARAPRDSVQRVVRVHLSATQRHWLMYNLGFHKLKHDKRTGKGGKCPGAGKIPAPYFSLRRPNRAALRAQGERFGVVGVFEAAAQGIEAGRAGTAGLSEQSQLPARLHAGTH